MSNPDSFIDEVTEEVRRERMFSYLRRYGWIGIAIVLLIVGGAAYTEWNKAQTAANSQAFGDAILAALDQPDAEARHAALTAVEAEGDRSAVLDLLLASDPATNRAGALAALEHAASDASLPASYRDLAVLRRVILAGADLPLADRRALLDGIAAAGRPFRPLALEQMAYLSVEAGETEAAITQLRALTADQEAPAGLRQRAQQMIVALGGETAAS
ncbi:hypothetical protein C5F48_09405 [Cereibacter changlensis JA139]|uniref:Tetratricopeptide repeat-like domain-containing protein n=2 Tax=Cereibacter changlensis TaxID=402884 RepID=A0A2T4JW24_9RHOB|nr:hypothetical protein [Cereibacter changlensis]PTE22007.1 hypothetical protein C5F48_09405 [Cereibacter changlensis JA139]PZX57280.1 hypothetical protein LX76_00822 [Cereibacter changlensis]